jgi:mono/diheme cytochrome c family protein
MQLRSFLNRSLLLQGLVVLAVAGTLFAAFVSSPGDAKTLPNLLPLAPPYLAAETADATTPFEPHFKDRLNPGRCATCHSKIFAQWNGSMMSNSWRDPAWRGAFYQVSHLTSTVGNCAVPDPPDGTERARLNPFANSDCSSTFDLGTGSHRVQRSGSLLDGFCSQCHMPSNYADNTLLSLVRRDPETGFEDSHLDPRYDPTSDNGTGIAFATLDAQLRNTESGKRGVFCAVCHSLADTRETAFANYRKSGGATPPIARGARRPDRPEVPDPRSRTLGYAIGAGAYQMSPHALAEMELLGPLASGAAGNRLDPYLSGVFGTAIVRQKGEFSGHTGAYQALHERAEVCASCHDVTNTLPIRNQLGRWVGGFPIERTYTEWSQSRYADRPGNKSFDPSFKRDCQTCHMQQDFGQPGTAQALYKGGKPLPPLTGKLADDGPERSIVFSHHFIGGNTYLPRLAGADVDEYGDNQPAPELSAYSFSSADEKSLYHYAYWTRPGDRGPATQHARLAWDRLRHVLDLELAGPALADPGSRAPLRLSVTNSGSGHDFPSGFPEGRNAWLAVHAFDLATGRELPIYDAAWRRTSLGVGSLTRAEQADPNFPGCKEHKLPAGSPDPFAYQFRAVATLGDGCPTLALPYATPLNLVVNGDGLPVDAAGRAIDRKNPRALPIFRDLDGDGDLFDDSFLVDTRLRPLPHAAARVALERYSVVIPPGTRGPVAVTAAVYYQSLEAMVARKFLGNLADTDTDFQLEPCVLGGLCDGRSPAVEPAVVEGAPPVPMEVRSWVIALRGAEADRAPPALRTYPPSGARDVYQDAVVKVFLSEPIAELDPTTFTLRDPDGRLVPAFVDQIGDGAWGLFPHRVFLEGGETYTARVAAGICDASHNCTKREVSWSFRVAIEREGGSGSTAVPVGFPIERGTRANYPR